MPITIPDYHVTTFAQNLGITSTRAREVIADMIGWAIATKTPRRSEDGAESYRFKRDGREWEIRIRDGCLDGLRSRGRKGPPPEDRGGNVSEKARATMGPARRPETRAAKADATESSRAVKTHASGPGGRRSQEERRASGAKMVVSVSLDAELVREVDAALGDESRSEYVARALRARLDADR